MIKDQLISDQELLIKIGKNDLPSLELLYNRYSAIVYTIALNVIKNNDEASDILHEVFLIIWKWAEHFDFEVRNVFTWIILLTRNKSIDCLRRLSPGYHLPVYDDDYEIREILPKLSPEIEILEREYILRLSDKITDVINTLNEEQKEKFHSVFIQGMDEQQVCAGSDIPSAALKLELQQTIEILMQKIIR